jgi:hypothetical protein
MTTDQPTTDQSAAPPPIAQPPIAETSAAAIPAQAARAPAPPSPKPPQAPQPPTGLPAAALTIHQGLADRLLIRMAQLFRIGFTAFSGRVLGPYQAAVVRIGFGFCFAAFLLREWPNRRVLYGDRAPWSLDLARQLLSGNHAFTVLTWSDSRWWFELVYHAAIAAAVLVMLGWRTRAMTVVFMAGVLSIQNRSIFVGDGGDNVIHVMSTYLVFTRCAEVWSLDARRRRRPGRVGDRGGVALWSVLGLLLLWAQLSGFSDDTLDLTADSWFHLGWGAVLWTLWAVQGVWYAVDRRRPGHELRALLDAGATMLHNCAMLVIAAQVCLIYSTAGWYKIQGSRWQDGTALYYPLKLDYFAPWPWLTGLLAGNLILVFLISYGTVAVQVAFPFTLVNRKVKNTLLVLMMAEHTGIAVALGLPIFSIAMISADAVFLPTAFLLWAGARVAGPWGRFSWPERPGRAPDPATESMTSAQ